MPTCTKVCKQSEHSRCFDSIARQCFPECLDCELRIEAVFEGLELEVQLKALTNRGPAVPLPTPAPDSSPDVAEGLTSNSQGIAGRPGIGTARRLGGGVPTTSINDLDHEHDHDHHDRHHAQLEEQEGQVGMEQPCLEG